MNNNYENKFLPESLRNTLMQPGRVTKQNDREFLRMFSGQELKAIKNNYYASEVATGYLFGVNTNYLMSGIAPNLLAILTRKIANEVIYEGDDEKVKTFKESFRQSYFTGVLKEGFSNSLKTGRDYMVLDFVNGKPTIRNFDLFRGIIKTDTAGNITDAKMFVNMDNEKAFAAYTIVEHRFYKTFTDPLTKMESTRAFQRYELEKITWVKDGDFDKTERISFDKDHMPKEILDKYKDIKFNKDIMLDTLTLGVYTIDNTAYNTKYPYTKIPESQFVNIQDTIMELETARTFKEVDKNLGRGRAMLPTLMKAAAYKDQYGNMTSPMDTTFYTQYQTLSMEDSKPQSIQFALRSAEWREEISGVVGDICAAFGISVMDYDPRLLQSGQRTDDEINAMTDITYSTVMDKRELAEESINNMLSEIAMLLGIENSDVKIHWCMNSILNPTRNTAMVTQQLQNGLISKEKAIARLNPDMSSKDVEEEIKKIKAETEAITSTEYDAF